METNMAKNTQRAKFVKKQREERAWPQRQLAEVADVNLRTIQRLEKDGAASFETLMAVAQAFGIDVKELNPTSRAPAAKKSDKKVHLLPRLNSGKDLVNIIEGADQFIVEHDDADDKRAVNAMTDMLKGLKRDIVLWHDGDVVQKFEVENFFSSAIKELDGFGFYLFGNKRDIHRITKNNKSAISICTIFMSHCRSLKIVRDKKSNMVIPALLSETSR